MAGSDLIAISKPTAPDPELLTCPLVSSFKIGAVNLVDTAGKQVFTPVPANQIDPLPAGIVVARNGSLPSNKLWFFTVTKDLTKDSFGIPVFGGARGLTVNTYDLAPAATQPGTTQKLDTSDARMTQAVMAFNPRTKRNEFWTQHTIRNARVFSAVRYYEIDPVKLGSPSTNVISSPGNFVFNGAISPDRVLFGATAKFGNSFVLEFNRSGTRDFPEIRATSSVNGAKLSDSLRVVQSGGSYTCQFPNKENTCRWGDYSGLSPDPILGSELVFDRGVVWGTNQFAAPPPSPPPPTDNWSTQIFSLVP